MPNNDLETQIRQGKGDDIYRSRVASGNRDPRVMQVPEIIEEIKFIRETIEMAAQRIVQLSQTMQEQVRRSEDNTQVSHVSISFASTWGRFAGAIQQGLRRTMATDRLLERALLAQKEEKQATEKREASRKKKASTSNSSIRNPNPLRTLEGDSIDDLVSLYGKEIVANAHR